MKTKIINTLGTDRIFQLLGDRDERIIMKTLGLLRNLLSNTLHIETIMSEHATEVLRAVSWEPNRTSTIGSKWKFSHIPHAGMSRAG